MPGVLDKVTVDLGPTATYKRRSAEWVPGDRPGEGLLTILLWKGLRAGSKVERDVYQVQEQDAVGVMGRSFLLLNVTDDQQPDVYGCVAGPAPTCTCKAGQCKQSESCKHRDSLRKLIKDGHMGAAGDPAPVETCGFCSGRGWVHGPTHDRFGYELPPRRLGCEYCGGSGRCEDGHNLLPAREPRREEADTGNPVWA